MEQIADRIRQIKRKQVKTDLLLRLISKSSFFDAKARKDSPDEARELDEEVRGLLIRKVEELQGVHPMDASLRRTCEEDEEPRHAEPQPEQRRRREPVPVPKLEVENILEDVRNDLPAEVSEAIDEGISDQKREQIARLLVSNGFAPVGNIRRAPGQVAPPSKEGLEYANLAALNEHSGRVSLNEQMTAELLSGRDTGSSRIDTNLPE